MINNDTMPLSFGSIGSMVAWSGGQVARYVANDDKLPYVQKGNMYFYFGFTGLGYELVMTSELDLGEARK